MDRQLRRVAKTQSRGAFLRRLRTYMAVSLLLALPGCFHSPHIIDDRDALQCETQGLPRGTDANANCALKRATDRLQSGETLPSEPRAPAPIQKPLSPAYVGGVTQTTPMTVTRGVTALVNFSFSLKPDCTIDGLPAIRIEQQPAHGTAQISPRHDYALLPELVPAACRDRQISGVVLEYTPARDYIGPDFIQFETTTKAGKTTFKVPITVNAQEQADGF